MEKSQLRDSVVLHFGVFQVNLAARELRKHGVRVRLPGQPFCILSMLLERPGEIVTREEMQQKLWASDTFVDFEHSLNSAIKKLRTALGDTPENSVYIETVPRVGYRFIAPVGEATASGTSLAGDSPATATASFAEARGRHQWFLFLRISAVSILTLAAGYFVWSRVHVRPQPFGGRLMLAVLPFENLTGDAGQDYFSDGLTEEMITYLSGFEPDRLGVIARTSVMRYKHSDKPIDQIGRELGLHYVLEGSVRRDGARLRISAQLIRVQDQSHLWAKEYDRTPGDILGVESEVAEAVTRSIQLNLNQQHQMRAARPVEVDPEVHNLYLEGRYFWNRRTDEGYQKAIDYFNRAIAKDPTYASPFSGVADAYLMLGAYGAVPQTRTIAKAREAAKKALELDDTSAEAHASLALILEIYDWDWAGSEREYKRAIQLNPNYATAHHWYGAIYLAEMGRFDEALTEMKQAQVLDPISPIIVTNMGTVLYLARRNDEAIQQFNRALELDPGFPVAHSRRAFAFAQKGMFTSAIQDLEQVRQRDESNWVLMTLGYIYGLSGDPDRALSILAELERRYRQGRSDAHSIRFVYQGLGEKDATFAWLEKEYQEHSTGMLGLNVSPDYDSLRSDRRFQDLLRRVGLAGSGTTGKVPQSK